MAAKPEKYHVTVSDSTIIAGDQAYLLADIETISFLLPLLSRTLGWGVAALGAVILTLGLIVQGSFSETMVPGIALLAVGMLIALTIHEHYTVRLNRRTDPPVLLQFADMTEAQRAATTIGTALNRRHYANQIPLSRNIGV